MNLTDQPASSRFEHHVSFDTFASGESTEKNTLAFTLNIKHKGYQLKKHSRTFMVGVGENEYSDIALQWMLEELVDDGDEIICVHVIDKDSKVVSDRNMGKREYQTEAKELLQRIQVRNDDNRAICIVLEFVAGKLHATFQRMIQLYEPAMLIVGTKGRSLGGLQGLMSNRNSFSKWCLQYSPIPVIIVRPTSKRIKKKIKRDADPARQDYIRILRESGIEGHETDTDSQCGNWEVSNNLENEAHAVTAALGFSEHVSYLTSPQVEEGKSLMRARSDHVNLCQEKTSQDYELSPKLVSNNHNPCIEEHKPASYTKNIDGKSSLDQNQLEENIRLEEAKSEIITSQNPYQFQMAFETSESSLESQVATVDEQDNNEEETEFEVISGSFFLNESEISLSKFEKKLEEIEMDDFLIARETTFLAAQIARNFSMDDCIFRDDNVIK
ncbi:putative universal stress protein [Erysiphe neolycopersici]|uniref:Putative universal stress protein n=1 Tax=Erysiphe neolycopersici TaxID=212602 RepID=A0A420I055_9PEZI|nr:putative universal stress protein [Erysiphe neolycopersici]